MPATTIALLALSSLVNAFLCFGLLAFALFATSPLDKDVTMRIGFYVLNAVAFIAFAGVAAPWAYARKQRNRLALLLSLLPIGLTLLAVAAFLTLDSWISRTFAS